MNDLVMQNCLGRHLNQYRDYIPVDACSHFYPNAMAIKDIRNHMLEQMILANNKVKQTINYQEKTAEGFTSCGFYFHHSHSTVADSLRIAI